MSKDIPFSKEELDKIEELARTNTILEIARHFKLSETQFITIKKKHPEVNEAFKRGFSIRKKNLGSNGSKKKQEEKPVKLIKIKEYHLERTVSSQDALDNFYKLKEEEKKQRLRRELKNIDLL